MQTGSHRHTTICEVARSRVFLGGHLYRQQALRWRSIWVSWEWLCQVMNRQKSCSQMRTLRGLQVHLNPQNDPRMTPFPFLFTSRSVTSYADGPRSKSTGRLLFYLTKMDRTAYDAEGNATVTLAIAEASLPGACLGYDAEDPPCSKITVVGQLLPVPDSGVPEAKVRRTPCGTARCGTVGEGDCSRPCHVWCLRDLRSPKFV